MDNRVDIGSLLMIAAVGVVVFRYARKDYPKVAILAGRRLQVWGDALQEHGFALLKRDAS